MFAMRSTALAENTLPRFPIEQLDDQIWALWGDGADYLYAATDTTVFMLQRSGRMRRENPPNFSKGTRVYLAGCGSRDKAEVVAWNDAGKIVRLRNGRIREVSTIPTAPSGQGAAPFHVVDSAGRFYLVFENGEMLLWQRDAPMWATLPAPAPNLKLRGATLGPADSVLVLAAGNIVYQYDLVKWQRLNLPLAELSTGAQKSEWHHLWYSEATNQIYIGAEPNYVLRIRLFGFRAQETRALSRSNYQPIVEPLGLEGLRGVTLRDEEKNESHDFLWMTIGPESTVFAYDGSSIESITLLNTLIHGGLYATYLDVLRHEVLIATRTAVLGMPLSLDPSLVPKLARQRDRSFSFDAAPLLRIGIGPLWRLGTLNSTPPDPAEPPTSARNATELAVDLSAGATVFARRSGDTNSWHNLLLQPELGYSFAATAPVHTHLGMLGLGIGGGHPYAYFFYSPRIVAGTALGGPAVGFRHALSFNTYGEFRLELAHQYLISTALAQHDLRLMVHFDFQRLISTLILIIGLAAS